jgi:hypothetical protein
MLDCCTGSRASPPSGRFRFSAGLASSLALRPSPFDKLRVRDEKKSLILSLSKDGPHAVATDCRRMPFRLRAFASPRVCLTFCKRLSLDNSFSFYAGTSPCALKSFANLFFHYKSYPAFNTPSRELLLSFDFCSRRKCVLDSIRGRYLGRLKVPIRRHRETRQVRVHFCVRPRVHTRVRPCSIG